MADPLVVNLAARCAPAWEMRSEMEVRREEVALVLSLAAGVLVVEGTSRPAQP